MDALTNQPDLPDLAPDSEYASLVERVQQNGFPWVVVPATAVARWEDQDPAGWSEVSAWVAARGVAIVRV
jgi:hypothetical protein